MEKKITLKELGNNLSLGVFGPDSKYSKELKFRNWRMKEEKELAELKEQYKDANVGKYVSVILSTMCEKIGCYNFKEMQFEKRMILISQMYMGDVFTAYCNLRKHALGNLLGLMVSCPICKNRFDFDGDLDTLEVVTAEKAEDKQFEYKLRNPFEINGKKITGFILGLPKWHVIESTTLSDLGETGAKISAILGSIVEIKGDKSIKAISENELDEMSKLDFELMVKKIDDNVLGPVMTIESKCPKCKKDLIQPLDWRYDHFFANSSR